MIILLIFVILMTVSEATATETPEVPPITAGPIIGNTAVPIAKGIWGIQPFWNLSFDGGHFTSSWRRVSVEKEFTTLVMPVEFKYGLAQDLEIRMIIPYVHNWAHVSDPGPGEARFADFGGLGDLQLGFKYLLWKETRSYCKTYFPCHPERSEGSQVLKNARFFASLRMTFPGKPGFCNSF